MKIESLRAQAGEQGRTPAAQLGAGPGHGMLQGQLGPPALLQSSQFLADQLCGTGISAQVADALATVDAETQLEINSPIAAPLARHEALPSQGCQLVPA